MNAETKGGKMMKRSLFAVAIGVGLALLGAGPSSAQECTVGCGAQIKACVRTARGDAFACKLDCLTNAPADGRRACLSACGDKARAARGSCGAQQGGCQSTCTPPNTTPIDRACLAPCGTALGDCAKGVFEDAKTCLSGCRDAVDRLGCVKDCITGAQTSGSGCAADLSLCAAGCGVPTPPPLPTPTPGGSCTKNCGAALTHCLGDVANAVFACGLGCAGNANPFQCLLACKDPAQQGAATCRTDFNTCTASCAP